MSREDEQNAEGVECGCNTCSCASIVIILSFDDEPDAELKKIKQERSERKTRGFSCHTRTDTKWQRISRVKFDFSLSFRISASNVKFILNAVRVSSVNGECYSEAKNERNMCSATNGKHRRTTPAAYNLLTKLSFTLYSTASSLASSSASSASSTAINVAGCTPQQTLID